VAVRFREVEVEARDGVPDGLVDEIVALLRAGGAGPPDNVPKVVRAMGPHAAGPPELSPVSVPSGATVADVVRAAVTRSVLQLLAHDPAVRLDDGPEAIHQARVATRRLRSDLRTFADVVDPEWADGLRKELRAVADDLGAVRDADVRLQRLERHVARLPAEDRGPAGALLQRQQDERTAARARLLELLDSSGYAELLDRLVEGARVPQLLAVGGRPAVEVLPALVRRTWKGLRKATRGDDLHGVRIAAKRSRYAAEVATLVVGKPAARYAAAMADVQDVLGAWNDAVVSEAWLRSAAAGSSPSVAFVAGQLVARERREAASREQAWPKTWKRASRGNLRTWL
jgi:CHAD domain-containing protein